jgi:hypothetical protein
MRDVFDTFNSAPESPLFGLMSPFERKKGKISRVTFNGALKPVLDTFSGADTDYVYQVLAAYFRACLSGLRQNNLDDIITNPTMFKALAFLFPLIAEKVSDRHGSNFTVTHFESVLMPMFERVRKGDLANPGKSPAALVDIFKKGLRTGFTIGTGSSS